LSSLKADKLMISKSTFAPTAQKELLLRLQCPTLTSGVPYTIIFFLEVLAKVVDLPRVSYCCGIRYFA
jgi:hypothetical protein